MDLSNNSISLLQKSMDYVWQKQEIVGENIANATTPGYKAKYLTFEDELRRALNNAVTSSDVRDAISNSRAKINVDKAESLTADGNNVDMDAEYVELARAQLQYFYLINQANDQFTRLRAVIQG